MKKKIIILLIIFVCLMGLSSCGKKEYEIKDYILTMDYKPDFKILQLTDIHLANKDNQQLQLDYLTLTINDANPDLIVVTGDMFTFADKATAKRLFKFLDSFGCKWTVTFGNHDEQCYFSIDWLTKFLNNYKSNCLFIDNQDDNVYGNANFAINLMDGATIKEQVILMDSNRYCYGEYIGYDYIKKDQITWYERLVNYTTEQNGGTPVPSMIFCHIPIPEYDDAWNSYELGDPEAVLVGGEKNEKVCCPKKNTGLFDKMKSLGSTKAMFCGHDHINSYRILYQGIYLCYGVNSTDRIYYKEDRMGGSSVIIHNDNTLDFEYYYHTYKELN